MKIFYKSFLLFILIYTSAVSQTISEKEILTLKFKGNADAYNLKYDIATGNYAYAYNIPDEGRSFIISNKTLSDKYEYIAPEEIIFDSKGNYYAVASDYRADYGTNNYFLIVNGKVIKSYDYIEAYSAYINNKNEYVFIFKEKDIYRLGYYSPSTGFRQSGEFDNIKATLNSRAASEQMEGDAVAYKEEDFFHNDKNERAFIATLKGKTKIIFETSVIETQYSDIHESSLTKNKNNELSFIAKTGGRFYEVNGNEFAVSGNKEYKKFDIATAPLYFNNNNEPVYIAGDSVLDYKNEYFLVIGDQKQNAFFDAGRTEPAPPFSYVISDIKINSDGSINYTAASEVVVKAENVIPGEEVYDQYYSRSFFVKDGIANELGYNVNFIKYNDKGDMLYSGIADIAKKEYLLMLNYGQSRIIISDKKYDDIYDYGFTPSGEIYYTGQKYGDPEKGITSEASMYIGNKPAGSYYNIIYQGSDKNASSLKYDSKNNYSFVAENKIDSVTFDEFVVTNSERLPFPENVSNAKYISYISNLMYTKNDKMFYIGDMLIDPVTYNVTKEVFVDNNSLGKKYNTIYPVSYDEVKNEITYNASRGNKVYFVTVKF